MLGCWSIAQLLVCPWGVLDGGWVEETAEQRDVRVLLRRNEELERDRVELMALTARLRIKLDRLKCPG